MATGPSIAIEIARKRHAGAPLPVFEDFSLGISAGETLALVGPSGVGKSTLSRIVAGIDRAYSGTVTVDGVPADRGPPPGVVFQDARLLPWLTVRENVRIGRAGLDRGEADRLLARVELAGVEGSYPHALSGGMQRRVAIARALAANQKFLVLDEPFVSLDPGLFEEMLGLVAEVIGAGPASVLLVTHRAREAARLADRVVLVEGRPARIVDTLVLSIRREDRGAATIADYAARIAATQGLSRRASGS